MAIKENEATRQIDSILNEFDFDKVHAYMYLVDWDWHYDGVPTVADLRECASELLWECANSPKEYTGIGTGGFCAHKGCYGEDASRPFLSLAFEIEDQYAIPKGG